MPNRLAAEPSPYLLQHANNPVDWYPWGEEAFEAARRKDVPIFLSIGYSTCHWCHVMEQESFEDAEIAAVLNENFVAIKVDREERPDVDRVYMTFVQATTGTGGWPMSVWLTPDLKPFYGGTYFPPTSRWGRPGFAELLREIARLWRVERGEVLQSAEINLSHLRAKDGGPRGEAVAGLESLNGGIAEFGAVFDRRYGGFGPGPKFPRPCEILFLLRAHHRTGSAAALEMAMQTLRAMALGGMRDHVGGGFHRYSVDERWRVPHFEKMLYDQAQLVLAYLEAAQASREADRQFFLDVAEDTLAYVAREMTGSSGGFFSAEDADSLPPEAAQAPGARKSEGAFYTWRDSEIATLLGSDADVVRYRFGIEANGNAPADPHGEFLGKNLLYVARPVDEVARLTGRSVADVERALRDARWALAEARARRPRPHLDDKILTAWNGLMIAAFARAARVLAGLDGGRAAQARGESYLDVARRAALFIRSTLWHETRGIVLRRFRDDQASIDGYAEDYACLIWGLLELFQADGDPQWLEWAIRLQARQDALFWDEAEAGWFSTTGEDPTVLLRLKEEYDGAEPSPGSVSVLNLLTLAHLTGDRGASAKAGRTLKRYGSQLGRAARIVPLMLCAAAAYHTGLMQIVIVGPPGRLETQQLQAVVSTRYLPFALTIPVKPGPGQKRLAQVLPWVGAMRTRDDKPTAYVCRDFVCRAPVTDPVELAAVLA